MEKIVDRLGWIRDLVQSEEKMEESGIVDLSIGLDNQRTLVTATLRTLSQLKSDLVDASNSFNELKSSPVGRIKIYGIAKTHSDFMLFRNGYKMVFSLKQAGVISIRFNFLGPVAANNPNIAVTTNSLPSISAASANQLMEENLLVGKQGPLGEIHWTVQDQNVQLETVVKYHLSLFIKESSQ